ncbi:hypothetical protein RE476_00785 [Methanolobus mangrovi]|uniref:Uncharacterized protein n=1 Tax=Methanolobus mangrovi TaxID=3072977 RepID=A0AA51YJP8_9EURY|nr:hypothetical protein [Methanolobus mangrovi]WMW22384.1 hypothetical protein RE476_00785 [Methanolobus mangrovi]
MGYPKIILSVLLMTLLLLAATGCVEPDGTSICVVDNQTNDAKDDQTNPSSQGEYAISRIIPKCYRRV